MSREILALLLMLLLMLTSGWNIRTADKLRDDINDNLIQAENAALAEDMDRAQQNFGAALKAWLDAESYTHIFIRHTEIDSCTDAFYELEAALHTADREETQALFDKLRYHVNSIADMEYLRLGNIL